MKTIQLIVITVFMATLLIAQPREGKNKELSLSGSYQNYSSENSSESAGALLVSPRLGFFVFEGLELEPELLFMFPSGSEPVYMANGNVSYNFISHSISGGKGVPFILLGYGIANTVPFFNVPMTRTDFSIGVLNLGGGVKAFIRNDIAIRIEYRYQKFSGQGTSTMGGSFLYTNKVDFRIHTVQFGLSVLL